MYVNEVVHLCQVLCGCSIYFSVVQFVTYNLNSELIEHTSIHTHTSDSSVEDQQLLLEFKFLAKLCLYCIKLSSCPESTLKVMTTMISYIDIQLNHIALLLTCFI